MAVVPLHTSRLQSRTLDVIEEIAELLGGIPHHWQYVFDILPAKVFFPPAATRQIQVHYSTSRDPDARIARRKSMSH